MSDLPNIQVLHIWLLGSENVLHNIHNNLATSSICNVYIGYMYIYICICNEGQFKIQYIKLVKHLFIHKCESLCREYINQVTSCDNKLQPTLTICNNTSSIGYIKYIHFIIKTR